MISVIKNSLILQLGCIVVFVVAIFFNNSSKIVKVVLVTQLFPLHIKPLLFHRIMKTSSVVCDYQISQSCYWEVFKVFRRTFCQQF